MIMKVRIEAVVAHFRALSGVFGRRSICRSGPD
jgi:hypothetical protein